MASVEEHIDNLLRRYPVLEYNRKQMIDAYAVLEECYENRGKLLVAGNGGSASDADHIVGELMKGFYLSRTIEEELADRMKAIDYRLGEELAGKLQCGLPAIALSNHNSLNTAVLNDIDGNICFAQQILGYGVKGDSFLGISTSGNSKNILFSAIVAKAKGLKVIGLTGKGGGSLSEFADVLIDVAEEETYNTQELHLPIYHCLCMALEDRFFGDDESECCVGKKKR